MLFVIPTSPESPNYTQRVTLDGREYLFRVLYNQREDTWFLSILDTTETPILQGLKLVTDWPLFRKFRHDTRVPPGELFALTLTGDDSPAGLGELGEGQRVALYYFDKGTL